MHATFSLIYVGAILQLLRHEALILRIIYCGRVVYYARTLL